jgi:hypothetical protein
MISFGKQQTRPVSAWLAWQGLPWHFGRQLLVLLGGSRNRGNSSRQSSRRGSCLECGRDVGVVHADSTACKETSRYTAIHSKRGRVAHASWHTRDKDREVLRNIR